MARIRMFCEHCGSENVRSDAWVTWDVAAQEWVIEQVMPGADWCDDCDGDTSIEEEEIAEPRPAKAEG